MCTGTHYIGGFIGYNKSKRDWLKERTPARERNIHTFRKTAGTYPQESYAVVVRVIQSKWIFLQHVMKNTGEEFTGVEEMLREIVLPRLFFGESKSLSPIVGTLSTMLV